MFYYKVPDEQKKFIDRKYQPQLREISRQHTEALNDITGNGKSKLSGGLIVVAIILAGLIAFLEMGRASILDLFDVKDYIEWDMKIMVIIDTPLLIAAYLIAFSINPGKKKLTKKLNVKIEEENEKARKKREAVLAMASKEYEEYKLGYETEFRRKSLQYVGSPMIATVVDWAEPAVIKPINDSDRRPHIKNVQEEISLTVYYNKITVADQLFDFKIQCCKNLNSVSEISSVANAIATELQTRLIMDIPNDISGTVPNVFYKLDYTSLYTKINIIYEAPNGSYAAPASF